MTVSQTVAVSTTTVATWTASAEPGALVDLLGAARDAAGIGASSSTQSKITVVQGGLDVVVTVGSQPGVCADTTSLEAPENTQVYFCVTLHNTGAATLTGFVFTAFDQTAPLPSTVSVPPAGAAVDQHRLAAVGTVDSDRAVHGHSRRDRSGWRWCARPASGPKSAGRVTLKPTGSTPRTNRWGPTRLSAGDHALIKRRTAPVGTTFPTTTSAAAPPAGGVQPERESEVPPGPRSLRGADAADAVGREHHLGPASGVRVGGVCS